MNITKRELELLIKNNTYKVIGKMYGVTDSAIRKKAKVMGIFKRKINYTGHNYVKKENVLCKQCFDVIENCRGKQIFCSRKCAMESQLNSQYEKYIERWKSGLENGMKGKVDVSSHIRRYLHKKYKEKCCKCGWCELNIYTNKIPLQINHIDGNCLNNNEENLELMCPNCHTLTPTWGKRNKTKGRRKIIEESS